jgi:hypothetical protein
VEQGDPSVAQVVRAPDERIPARKYLSGKAPEKFGDYFRRMYPDVEIPARQALVQETYRQ